MFYDEFVKRCNEKGVSRTKACIDCGVSRTAWHKWEHGAIPNGTTLNKIASYFGITVGQLLGDEEQKETPGGEARRSDDDIKFALFGGGGEITDAMFDEVRQFAQMVKLREENKKKKE